jgi:DNA-binding transcriptional regulator YiaG
MGETIEAVRNANNLTCKQFGKLLGVSERTVQGWKQGRKVPKFAILIIKCLISKGDLK